MTSVEGARFGSLCGSNRYRKQCRCQNVFCYSRVGPEMATGRKITRMIVSNTLGERLAKALSERSSTRFCSLFSLRPSELIQGFLMQDPNLSQVSLRFFNVVLYGIQLFPDCPLVSMIQRGFKPLDAKCSTNGKGISLLYSITG